ncbi:MAG: hypothetical protein WAU42_09285 [Solirubrobacteraceae bacterium]
MHYSLDDAKDKLGWANRHFERLASEIKRFEDRDNHRFSVKINADEGKYTFYVHDLEPVNPDWSLIVGDCIHNARTALDYLMVQLYAAVTGQDPRQVKGILFPISDDPSNFNGLPGVIEARKHLAFSGYLTRIEELQPYNALNPTIWPIVMSPNQSATNSPGGALSTLNRLDIRDKHRALHAAQAAISIGGSLVGSWTEWPTGFTLLSGGSAKWGPLVNDAEVADCTFATPLPYQWEPSQMDMKRRFPVDVVIDQTPPFIDQAVLVILPPCLWAVEQVLRLFQPVLTGEGPPLPVSAIQPYVGRLL